MILSPTPSMLNGTFFSSSHYGVVCERLNDSLIISHSKTVTALDVVYALKRSGRTLYGFGA